MTLDQLKYWLNERDWHVENNYASAGHSNAAKWYAWKTSPLMQHECEGNDGKTPSLVVKPYRCLHRGNVSVSVTIAGEANGIWWQLEAYQFTPQELIERLDDIEAGCAAAWNALPRKAST